MEAKASESSSTGVNRGQQWVEWKEGQGKPADDGGSKTSPLPIGGKRNSAEAICTDERFIVMAAAAANATLCHLEGPSLGAAASGESDVKIIRIYLDEPVSQASRPTNHAAVNDHEGWENRQPQKNTQKLSVLELSHGLESRLCSASCLQTMYAILPHFTAQDCEPMLVARAGNVVLEQRDIMTED